MWPGIQRRFVRRAYPGAYCAIEFGETREADRYRIFAPITREYLGHWCATPGGAWESAAYALPGTSSNFAS